MTETSERKPARVVLGVRVQPSAREEIDRIAEARGESRSDTARWVFGLGMAAALREHPRPVRGRPAR